MREEQHNRVVFRMIKKNTSRVLMIINKHLGPLHRSRLPALHNAAARTEGP